MVKCLHEALPKHLQAPKLRRPDGRLAAPSIKRQAAAIYASWARPQDFTANDIFVAIVECGKEQFKDRVYAELGRAGGKAGRRLGLSHGFGLGGYFRGQATGGLTPTR